MPRKKPTPKEDTHIYLEPSLRRWIVESAKKNMRSLTQEISFRLMECRDRDTAASG